MSSRDVQISGLVKVTDMTNFTFEIASGAKNMLLLFDSTLFP